MSETKILPCSCSSPGQDAIYGVGERVHNYATGKSAKGGINVYRCTVCGTERASGHKK